MAGIADKDMMVRMLYDAIETGFNEIQVNQIENGINHHNLIPLLRAQSQTFPILSEGVNIQGYPVCITIDNVVYEISVTPRS